MLRSAVLLTLGVALASCTTIKISDGDTSVIEHAAGVGVAEDLATRACLRAGQQDAEIMSTVNKDSALPAGTGRQVTTFRCLAAR